MDCLEHAFHRPFRQDLPKNSRRNFFVGSLIWNHHVTVARGVLQGLFYNDEILRSRFTRAFALTWGVYGFRYTSWLQAGKCIFCKTLLFLKSWLDEYQCRFHGHSEAAKPKLLCSARSFVKKKNHLAMSRVVGGNFIPSTFLSIFV